MAPELVTGQASQSPFEALPIFPSMRAAAVTASLGPTRALRKTYEASPARADALGHRAIESATSSVSATSSRSVAILLVYLLVALVAGVGVMLWIVRTILRPAYTVLRLLTDQGEARVTT